MMSLPARGRSVAQAVLLLALWAVSSGQANDAGAASPRSVGYKACRQLFDLHVPRVGPSHVSQEQLEAIATYYRGLTGARSQFYAPSPQLRPLPVPFAYCPVPKVGCSHFRLLIFRLTLPDDLWAKAVASSAVPEGASFTYFPALNMSLPKVEVTADLVTTLLANRQLPKIMLVRNPYVRVLSFYLDKVVEVHDPKQRPTILKGLGLPVEGNITFPMFAEALFQKWKNAPSPSLTSAPLGYYGGMDNHYAPQSWMCGLPFGMSFTHVFKFEKLPMLYPCLVKLLKLDAYVDKLWSPVQRGAYDCFYKPDMDRDCNWRNEVLQEQMNHFQSGQLPLCSVSPEKCNTTFGAKPSTASKAGHATNAAAKVMQYYDAGTAALMSKIYEQDLQLFQYPVWRGPSEPFRYS